MRRDHFTLTATHTDPSADGVPTLVLQYDGPGGTLTARLEDETGQVPDRSDIDAAFRLQTPLSDDDATGVFSVSRRLTGDYVFEAAASADDILAVVDAAREESGEYSLRIERPGASPVTVSLETLLVYDTGGELLRQQSLVPGGVEL
ncbi:MULTISPECIES: DUF5793 family protein [Salinibaculum]|uniref:DUF5793 family protein n=1 Tax=Salinibaculum TaxID=2732368 RepID=UPI0030D49F24